MQRLQAVKFELRPSGERAGKLRQFTGCCRHVYNKALARQQENHKAGAPYTGYIDMVNQLPGWRKEEQTSWLSKAPAHPLQQTLRDLDRACHNFFVGRAGFPGFKKKCRGKCFRFPEPGQFKFDQANSRIFLPKLVWLRYRNSTKHQRQLARAQRALARKQEFSSNWKKQKAKIARLLRGIATARNDYLHKTSHHICLGGPAKITRAGSTGEPR